MSMGAHTGMIRSAPCEACGVVVVQREIVGVTGPARGVKHWDHDTHDAPCGLPCLNGGVSGQALKSKRFHGSARFPCPGCTEKAG